MSTTGASNVQPAPLGRWPVGDRKMGIGFIMPISDLGAFGPTPRFQDMLQMTQTAEQLGYDAVWIPDHFIVDAPPTPLRGVWEGWTTLAALAAATSKITLGVFVTCLGWRNPGIVAKMAENLDEISNGRFILGLGAGWHEPEYKMFGFPFDYRVSRFDDAIKIISPLLRDGYVDHQGEYFQANNAYNIPRGPRGSEGGPPILVGTNGPKMMRLTATYADAWNSDWHHSPDTVAPLLKNVDEACLAVGRDPKTMIKTAGSNIAMPGCLDRRPNPIVGDTEAIAEAINGFRDLGLKHHVAGLDPCTPASLEQYARVIEILDKTEPTADSR
jgi:alkanesulfonate monooxygenase SsuD/methylene tetrahydromethanopterin reductase-like flavin-dependent oxidoreductase (luciferase family)